MRDHLYEDEKIGVKPTAFEIMGFKILPRTGQETQSYAHTVHSPPKKTVDSPSKGNSLVLEFSLSSGELEVSRRRA